MKEKLTFEEWCEKYTLPVTDEIRQDMKNRFNLDADKEIELALRAQYQIYINGEYEKYSQF